MYKITFVLTVAVISVNIAMALPGSGTQEDPWRIESKADFNEFAADSNYWDNHTRLDTDINLTGHTYTTAVIAASGNFTGVFDGNDHKIMSLTIDGGSDLGLFGDIYEGKVMNLGLEGGTVNGNGDGIGSLVAYIEEGIILNCYSTVDVNGNYYVGGLVGHNDQGDILNCYFAGNVDGCEDVGGLVGENDCDSIISNCYSIGDVNGNYEDSCLGGLVGENTGSISNCFFNIDTQSHGVTESIGSSPLGNTSNVAGLTTTGMQTVETYLLVWWDFKGEILNGNEDIWSMPAEGGYPLLTWQIEPSTLENDDFSQALQVNPGTDVNGTTTGATGLDLTKNGYNDSADVWYYFEPSSSVKYTIRLYESDFDTTLAIFDSASKEVIFNDDFFDEGSAVILKAVTGKRYYIRVSGHDGETGDFTLKVTEGAIQAIQGDLNYDGKVNMVDLALMAENWLGGL